MTATSSTTAEPLQLRPVDDRATAGAVSLLREAQPQPASPRNAHRSSRLREFRPDVEGLRAAAVVAVVAYHAGVPGASGGFVGVDVFLVISGFLITRHLMTELERTGRVRLSRFYARRVRRLLPAATLVLVVTGAAGWLVLDPLRARALTTDALHSAAYAMNWHLAQQGTDYLTATAEPSALQHYWSLAVEEQYYLVWPVLLLGMAALMRRLRLLDGSPAAVRRLRVTVSVALAAVVVASFAASVVQTAGAQPWAYFGLHTRAWELALGALVAVGARRLSQVHAGVAAGAMWLGLLGIGVAVTVFDGQTAFPGSAAALPVLGAALVIAGGCAAPPLGADLVLGRSPLQLVGALSYGWYLWHWPLLLLAPEALGHALDLRHRLLMCLIALGLAAASYALLEHPVRRLRWPELRPGLGVGLGVVLTGSTAALAALALVLAPTPTGRGVEVVAAELGGAQGPGIERAIEREVRAALSSAAVPRNLEPPLAAAKATLPQPQVDGCHAAFDAVTASTDCVYGDVRSSRTVVLFGDSHALQWFPALDRVATQQGLRLVSLTKSSCTPFSVTIYNETYGRVYRECDAWRADALLAIRDLRPDLVVVSSLTGVLDHGLSGGGAAFDAAWAAGAGLTVQTLRDSGARVAVVDDTTNPGQPVPECLAANLDDAGACQYYRAGGLHPEQRRSAQGQAVRAAGAIQIDPTPWLCGPRRCPVVVGNLLVFRDEQHLSTAYAQWLAEPLAARLGL